jgi:GNAT superfamily N-acetyltransferase
MTELSIRPVRYDVEPARTLVAAALDDLAIRYDHPGGDDTPVDPAEFVPPAGTFLVAWLDGRPVGCGGWRSLHGGDAVNLAGPAQVPAHVAEVKRMYVAPEARGRGVAMALLRALEDSARELGRKRIVLETGHKQPEAIALYAKAGYDRIEDFGFYKGSEGVRSFGRDL